jgi:hypothetical protein
MRTMSRGLDRPIDHFPCVLMRSFAGIAAADLSINENGRDASPLGKSDDAHFQAKAH